MVGGLSYEGVIMDTFKNKLIRAFPVWKTILKRSKPLVLLQGIAGGSTGAHTFSKIKKGDQLVGVTHHTIASLPEDLTDEFTITADGEISNDGGTDTSSNFIIATWLTWDAN